MAFGLIENDFEKGYENKIVLCLGFFDSVHIAHQCLIKKAKEISNKLGAECFAFTFKNNIFPLLGKEEKLVFTYTERLDRFADTQLDGVVFAKVSTDFLNMSAKQFLDALTERFDICGIVCGDDYRFGRNGEGNYEFLRSYFAGGDVAVEVLNIINIDNKKISTSDIKRCVAEGDMLKAKELLGGNYFIKGEVVFGRQEGRRLGFPTVNILFEQDKLPPKSGVYVSKTLIDDKYYLSMTNVGTQPTFDKEDFITETNIFDFNEILYGKILKIEFLERIRDVRRFSSLNELSEQLAEDRHFARNRSDL